MTSSTCCSSIIPSQLHNRASIRRITTNIIWVSPKLVKVQKTKEYHLKSCFSATTAAANPELRGGDKYGVGDKDGVIIVDHGSRRKESNLLLNDFVAMFRDKTGYPIVEPAHMELAEPSIKDAFGSCVRQGANRVIVSPYFLSPGRHWKQDIPSLTAEAAKEHPGVTYLITAPLGLHEQIVEVVNDRIKHCISHVAGDAEECAVCVGTGKCRLYHVES
ncbi:sirohydrochlorin ferrochelatase, chloroplastic-like [Papaver somniferum]|uniref:sirohydrochlorin ferrochelatase, chloroplastic-like n=1 Tax=Papaver somniferum TaxID=3469 RepID=UPI000E7001E4|nr:sirohydrochlorin ferrochelatase, chloroplastic-like [Papaver somniferum]